MNRDSAFRSSWVPVRSGLAYRVERFPVEAFVIPRLAGELERVLERFAGESGFTREHPVDVVFKPGTVGHHQVGRAADIYAVGGRGLDVWKARWDRVLHGVTGEAGSRTLVEEKNNNLGWRLYKALQEYGRWSQPYGYPIQLFGPWTRSEGPWTFISDRLLYAHRDHIHVAK